MKYKDVHTEHCCVDHGCKYCDDNCPVELGLKKQSYPCEDCDYYEEQSKFYSSPDIWYNNLLPFCSTEEHRKLLKEIYERAKNEET